MGNITFLIADDEVEFRQLMEEMLIKIYAGEAITILHAATGAEAISEFERSLRAGKPVDVVITDYAMPEATGSDVIEYIVGKHPVPIVVVSGVEEAQTHDFIQEGAIYFLKKPFDIATAKNVLDTALALNIDPDNITKAEEAIERLKNLNL